MDTTFETAEQGLRKTGASVESRELVELLTRHGSEEGAILEKYQRFTQDATTEDMRYLVQLIIDDERRHHRQLGEMANAIAWGGSKGSPDAAIPNLAAAPGGTALQSLVDETRQLLHIEKRDRAELKDLRKRLRLYADTTLWVLVVDLMLLDTEKHIRILGFIAKHASAR
ncbi:MAG: hypothetical protein ACYCV7_03010 [Acidimicrobiales bacterium]